MPTEGRGCRIATQKSMSSKPSTPINENDWARSEQSQRGTHLVVAHDTRNEGFCPESARAVSRRVPRWKI